MYDFTPVGSEAGMTLEEALVEVWRQALAEGAENVELDGEKFRVRETPRKHLREVDFVFQGGLPAKPSGIQKSNCAGWSRIRTRNRGGQNWRARGTR